MKRVIHHLLYWPLLYILNILFFGFMTIGYLRNSYHNQALFYAVAFPFIIATTYFTIYYTLPRFLYKKKYLQFSFLLLASLVVMGIAIELSFFHLVLEGSTDQSYYAGPVVPFLKNAVKREREASILVMGSIGLKLATDWVLNYDRAQKLEKSNLENELQLLRSQLQPHFLFNTLNNIYALAVAKSDHTPIVIEKLSKLLAYIVYDCKEAVQPLRKEVSLIEDYMDVERIRLSKEPAISMEIEEELLTYSIPPYLLMPFVENAFKHACKSSAIEIIFRLKRIDDTILYECINTAKRVPSASNSCGQGLENLRRRLFLIYGNSFTLTTGEKDGRFHASMVIPLSVPVIP